MIVARNTVKVRSATLGHSTSAVCANRTRWEQGYGYQTYYITTQHEDNDIRFATGFYHDIDLVTPVAQGYFSQIITSAQETAHPFDDPNGSSYHSIFWNGHVVDPVIQATIMQEIGLLRTTSSWDSTCTGVLGKYWIPVSESWSGTVSDIWTDPFGCQWTSAARYIQGPSSIRKRWYTNLTSYGFSQAQNPWMPNTLPGMVTIKYHATSAVGAVCGTATINIRIHCSTNSNGTPIIDFSEPIEDINFDQPAPTGWYRQTGSVAKYWNGAVGLWTNTSSGIQCPVIGGF